MKVGASRVDITPPLKTPLPLLGWGDPKHHAKTVHLPIHSRAAFFLDDSNSRLVFVCVEICFISESLRLGVMKELRDRAAEFGTLGELKNHEVVLTATHTHNAPGGYCHSILYNIPSRGYFPDVFKYYVSGIVESIWKAWNSIQSAELRFGSISIPADEKVAFNRSIDAFNLNRDVNPVPKKLPELATYRVMDGLSAFDLSGKLIVHLNWFAVHCTSVHRDFHAIHPDHKGVASRILEEEFRDQGSVVIFAQGAAGDVSPNFKKYWFKREMRGRFRDDIKSAEFNASIQARFAKQLIRDSKTLENSRSAAGEVGSIFSYFDCTSIPIPSQWVGGRKGVTTGPAALGCPFMAGTDEGRGAPRFLVWMASFILRLVYFVKGRRLMRNVQGNKVICVELSEGKVFGDPRPQDLPIPNWLDPLMSVIRFWSRIRVFRGAAMSPTIMPIQLFQIRKVGFISVPGEFTTQAGCRLRELLLPILRSRGIEEVIIAGYANSYAGYVTTEEEYQLQRYEGACTHFGRFTLLGYQAIFRQLAEKWCGKNLSDPRIPEMGEPAMKEGSALRKLEAGFFASHG